MSDAGYANQIFQAANPPRPTQRPTLPGDLTPEQMNGLQYSRDIMARNGALINPDGTVTSFMGAIADAPGGGYMNYPTYWDGKVIDWREAHQRALAYEQQTGKRFARYPTIDAANAGESKVHRFMEQDAQQYMRRNKR